MSENNQTFLLTVSVIEGRHYVWPNMNSVVILKIDNYKKSTAVKFSTNCPYYNEYFVFEFTTTIEKLIDKSISITVIKPGTICRNRRILGGLTLDVGTVWYQPDHQIYHKWAILSPPTKEEGSSTRGYLKLDICVLAKGQIPKISIKKNTDEIEGNLLLPDGTAAERQRTNFVFDIYQGYDFVKKISIQENSSKKKEHPASVRIEVSFAGITVKTSTIKRTNAPVWNERLVISDLFPPLCQRFKIALFHSDNLKAVRYLNLRDISNDKVEGFMPTFGLDFLHFYSSNYLEGYVGKILLSVHTNLLGNLTELETKVTIMEPLLHHPEDSLVYEQITLFVAIFEVSEISRKFGDKPISFRLCCGSLMQDFDDGDLNATTVTPCFKPKVTNRNYFYLPIESEKPCLYQNLRLPDCRKIMYNHNLITKMLQKLKAELDNIEDMFQNDARDVKTILLNSLDSLSLSVEKYLDASARYNLNEESKLYQQRQKLAIKEMESIKLFLNTISASQNKKKIFHKLEKVYARIEALVTNIETWPNVYLWMISGNKRVAYMVINPENIIYSIIDEETGINCGSLETVYFQSGNAANMSNFIGASCKMTCISWMGLTRHWDNYKPCLPSGFSFREEQIPPVFVAQEQHNFACQALIFQGAFSPGSDDSGLCDPVAQVIFGHRYQETQIMKKTLNPVWDQTLVFSDIVLYGSKNFILNNLPTVSLEIYDNDLCNKIELVGKALIKLVFRSNYLATTKLLWYSLSNRFNIPVKVLTAIELLEDLPPKERVGQKIINISPEIKPNLVKHRIEVVFWGVRNLKKVNLHTINKPKIVVQCTDTNLYSDTIANAKKNSNFTNSVKTFEAVFSEQKEYAPPLRIKMFDNRSFGITVLMGTHITSMWSFFYQPITQKEREKVMENSTFQCEAESFSVKSIIQNHVQEEDTKLTVSKKTFWQQICSICKCKKQFNEALTVSSIVKVSPEIEETDFDWWNKFYASLEPSSGDISKRLGQKYKLKIYPNELEYQTEFGGFTDTLRHFPMYRGKRTGDDAVDEDNTTGVFKGALKIYQWPLVGDWVTPTGLPLEKGIGVRPKDLNGRSDPYIKIILNEQTINDRQNCILGQVNPDFGRCFELNGIFPRDHTLKIVVMDWDATTADDLIGETKIDLENRFYTKHRAHCGLAAEYLTSGYAQWRDPQRPTVILEGLCKRSNIPLPQYESNYVTVTNRRFTPENNISENIDCQKLALYVLRKWSAIPVVGCTLVPEHVETRSLYNPLKPGIEQGKLQCWIDILPYGDLPMPPTVNIAPRKPVAYELRVIIWNTEKVPLKEDDFFTGEAKSDIYVKGWIVNSDSAQYTDVHYRSLSGEGNFNWRFIFCLEFLSAENKQVVREKSVFSCGEKIEKLPCQITLQVWDNDTFSSDDFLGILILDLTKLPRGSKAPRTCDLSILQSNASRINLFRTRRTKGWWPFKTIKDNQEVFAGCVELELEVLKKEDAEKSAAGLGRNEPQALPSPNRPDNSFSWFANPWKGFKYLLKLHKGKIIVTVLCLILMAIVLVAIYSFPGYTVKKLLGA